jgi:hypothetical protein
LPHLTSVVISCRAPPHTPRGVVVRQLQRPTCPTRAVPKVRQVRQPDETGVAARRKGAGTWWLKRPTAASNISARRPGSDRGVTLDSVSALGRRSVTRPRSTASAAFLRPRAPAPSSHGIPKVALAPLPERIIESYQAGHGSRRAVTQTAGLVGHSHACVGPGRERVRLGGAGPPTIPWESPTRTGGGQNRVRRRRSKIPRAQFSFDIRPQN